MRDHKKIKTFDRITIILIIISLTLFLFVLLMPVIIIHNSENQLFKSATKEILEFSQLINNITTPLIAVVAIFITFLAFYIQVRANKTQVDLFNKNQEDQYLINERELFYRLIDNLNNKIFNSKIKYDNDYYESFNSIDFVNKLTFKNLYNYLHIHGRSILQHYPEKVVEKFYFEIVSYGYNRTTKRIEEGDKLKRTISQMDINQRWEYLKTIVFYKDKEPTEIRRILSGIGGVYFYKLPFEFREDVYSYIYQDIYSNFSTLIESYIRGLTAILDYVEKSKNKNDYYNFIKSNISNQELCLIYYYLSSNQATEKLRFQIKNAKILNGQLNKYSCFIDSPSNEELENEIEYILNKKDFIY